MSGTRKSRGENQPQPEGYTVLARRYRPQQFADLVGQEHVARALVNALKSNRVAHAYLFTGARGVGKTSAARILARSLNCVNGPTPTPCGQCDNCQRIATGEDVDVLEIDGASNNKVDEVRELRSNVQYRPSKSRFKVYIIDEVHMLSTSAFNALLKTLEEPPAHVKFIFATTEVQKIPVTILSRCQRFDFAGIGTPRIVERLREVVAAEGKQADDEALELVARRAAGSMRDAQSLLDQLLAFGGDRLTAEQVHGLLGTAQDDRVVALASAVVERDPKKALDLLAEAAGEGLQLGELLDQLIDYWRDLMVLASAGEGLDLSVSPRYRETLAKQAAALPLDSILAGLDILSSTKMRLKGTSHPRILLEMALVRLSRLEHLVALSQLAEWLNSERGAGSGERGTSDAPRSPLRAPRSAEPPEGGKKKPLTAGPETTNGSSVLTSATLPQVWSQVMAQLGSMHVLHLEKAGLPAISGPNTLVIRFPAGYNHHVEYCQSQGPFERTQEVVRRIAGRSWNLRVQVEADNKPPPPAVAVETEDALTRNRRQREAAERQPLIQRAMEVLGAEIVRVDEGFGASTTISPEATGLSDTEE